MISFPWKEEIWSLTKKKENKETRKKNRIITLDHDSGNDKKVEL